MDTAAIIAAISAVIQEAIVLAPSAIKLEQAAEPYAKLLWDHIVNKKVITADDLAALETDLAATSARIQAAIPPEQDDDV